MTRTLASLFATLLASGALAAAVAQTPPPTQAQQQAQEQAARDKLQAARDEQQEVRDKLQAAQSLYQSALGDADSGRWDIALSKFSQIQQAQSADKDGAMYWSAYAESKLGQRQEALEALGKLQQQYPHSAWQGDAEALALELRQASGQAVSPGAQPNDDLKLLAINGLMRSDPAQALPLLEKVVNGDASPAVKGRALFVMAQSGSPVGTQELVRIAKEQKDPDLSVQAVRYLGMMGGPSGRAALAGVYAGSSNLELKRDILRSYMIGGDRARLLDAAKGETNPALRQDAIRDLALAGGKAELWQLYQTNPPAPAKATIIQALGLAGDVDHLIPLAKTEKDPALRDDLIRSLGLNGSPAAQTALLGLYSGANDRASSRAVIEALFIHNSAAALVSLARKETDPELKRDLVARISLMHSKAATDYLLEILNQ